jgi:hypothetical protein
MKRKYRIREEKFKDISHFYPQYKDDDCIGNIAFDDNNKPTYISEWSDFIKWEHGFMGQPTTLVSEYYDSLSEAQKRIEIDINQNNKPNEIIYHEYQF